MAYTDRLVNHAQMAEMIYQQTKHWMKADMEGMSDLEIEIASQFASNRSGKVFATKEWRFNTNTSSACEKALDSVGLNCEPSTDTVEGVDDFLQYLPFQWWRCNYEREEDGFARPTALEGRPNYRKEGAVDVGTLAPTFYWKIEDHGTYRMWYFSDTEHPELGLVPWCEAIRADGTVMPYYIYSAYPSVTASDGKARSQAGKYPAYNHSYNNIITLYQAKGKGYWGAGGSRNAHAYIFLIIKYATKNSQKKFAGCTSFYTTWDVAKAETGTKRVLLPNTVNTVYVGACISVGTASRNHSIVDRGRVTKAETVTIDGTNYTALYFDELADTITTEAGNKVDTMPCFAGETDAVIGKHDGSYLSNTDARHTYRIHGCEYNWGQWCVVSDTVIEYLEDNNKLAFYVAPRGTAHVANAHTNYLLVGTGFDISGGHNPWIGDEYIDEMTGAMIPGVKGTGDSVGVGDRWYTNDGTKGTLREYLALGCLNDGSAPGLCLVHSSHALSSSDWHYGSCD